MREGDKYNTEIDNKLRDLALTDWATFVKFMGDDAYTAMKICLMRKDAASYGMIQIKLNVSRAQARYASKREDCSCQNKTKI